MLTQQIKAGFVKHTKLRKQIAWAKVADLL
jgi:hypothetical protein